MSPDSPPLILHVIHHLVMGGMENGLVNLINNMPQSKYRHAIICIEDYSDFRHRISRADVEVVALHRSRIGTWKLRQRIYQLCRAMKPVLLHSRNQSGLDALLPARLAGVKHCIHGEHGWDVDNIDGRNWKPNLLRRLHSPLVDRYVTVSENLANFLEIRAGIRPSRISQIYNGVDTNRFSPTADQRIQWLPTEFFADGIVVIGTVGRIQEVKDQATLLRAFSSLVKSRPDLEDRLRLVIVGDGPLLPYLRALADSLQIGDSAFFPGALDNIPDVLRSFDVFVLPSLNEGISNTILEAMAVGIPVVATAVGGNTELIVENVCGRLFPPADTAMLSRLLAEYVSDLPRRRAHGIAARKIALERFSLSAMVSQYEAVYDSICRNP
jgi:sugar transferase (PEP-CTERM/EpsH1 system associated)